MLARMQARTAEKRAGAADEQARSTPAAGEPCAAVEPSPLGFVSRIPTPQGPRRVSCGSAAVGRPASKLPSPALHSHAPAGVASAGATPSAPARPDANTPLPAGATVADTQVNAGGGSGVQVCPLEPPVGCSCLQASGNHKSLFAGAVVEQAKVTGCLTRTTTARCWGGAAQLLMASPLAAVHSGALKQWMSCSLRAGY